MTTYQQKLLKDIENLKKELAVAHGDDRKSISRQLNRLAHWLTMEDDREYDLKNGRRNDPGGRSRSPSMGIFKKDDE